MGTRTAQVPKRSFIDKRKLHELIGVSAPAKDEVQRICNEALRLRGLSFRDAAALLNADGEDSASVILEAAHSVKQLIYGRRIVLFAPLYIGNKCSNNCLYCGFRRDNTELRRAVLSPEQIRHEVSALLNQGHKRLLLLWGEDDTCTFDYFLDALDACYSVRDGSANIRRINVEIAPLSVDEFRRLKAAKIGTYACFQETYDPDLYSRYHPSGPKADYENRLFVMHRAMTGGIDDVGIGALFGLGDHRFEVLALLEHAHALEAAFGCGPHTVSVPRLMPAPGSAMSSQVPHPVSDFDFKKIIAVLRLSLPYTGIILSTRESADLRNELVRYGVSQISAGSRTDPGAYSASDGDGKAARADQFSLGDHRSLDEVISELVDQGFVPSFCTGCYRKGRVGKDFMDLAKPGLIRKFCTPNGLISFQEYCDDYAGMVTRAKGQELIGKITDEIEDARLKMKVKKSLSDVRAGARDVYV